MLLHTGNVWERRRLQYRRNRRLAHISVSVRMICTWVRGGGLRTSALRLHINVRHVYTGRQQILSNPPPRAAEIACEQQNVRKYTLLVRYGKSEVFTVRPGRDAKSHNFWLMSTQGDMHGRALTSLCSLARCEVLMAVLPSETPVRVARLCGDTSQRTVLCAGLLFHTVNKITR